MYETNPEWKENQQNPLTSEGFVEVSYKVSDPDLPGASPTANNELSGPLTSQTSEIAKDTDRDITPYATLERNLWLLDGSKVTVPEGGSDKYSGYISGLLCEEDGAFSTNPRISIKFDETVTTILPGLTIDWGVAHGEYPTRFKVTPYNGGMAYDFKEVDDNKDVISIVDFGMTNFDRVEIQILKWCRGYKRARIGKVFLGINKVYTKSDLLKFSCSEVIDPVSASLPKYEIQFEIDNRDGAFNPINPEGLTKYMMERQEIRTHYGYRLGKDKKMIPGGVYYLSNWNAPQNGLSASFSARDLFGFMSAPYYKGEFPEKPEGFSLYELAKDVLLEANLPKDKSGKILEKDDLPKDRMWELDNSLKEIYTKSPLPVCSMAECLQLIASAAGCTILFERDGRLHIKPLKSSGVESDVKLEVNDDNSYSKAEISLAKPIKQIDVSRYEYVGDEKKELYSGELTLLEGENVFVLEYSDIAKDVVAKINEKVVSKNDIEYYAKCCKLVLDPKDYKKTCKIVIEGIPQKQTETVVVIPNLDKGETQPLKNILITDVERAQAVGKRLMDNLNLRKSFAVDWRIDPSLDTGDIVTVKNGVLENPMRVISSSFSFNGAFKGKSEGSEYTIEKPQEKEMMK